MVDTQNGPNFIDSSAHCETVAETDFCDKTTQVCLLGRLLAEHRNRKNCCYTWRSTIGRLK